MSSRRIIDGHSERADQTEDQNGDVEGHAARSGRVIEKPEYGQREVAEVEDEVEAHGARASHLAAAPESTAGAQSEAEGEDVEGHRRAM